MQAHSAHGLRRSGAAELPTQKPDTAADTTPPGPRDAGPSIRTDLPGPRARALIARDARVVSPSYTRGYPLVIARGSGAMVDDVDGNVFLDCTAGIAVTTTGHRHPAVVEAIVEQSQQFLHMSGTDFYYESQVRLAETLAEVAPVDGDARSFFANSGAEAIEGCIKLARYSTGRPNVIAFFGAFHGRTNGALALTASQPYHRRGFGPLAPGVYHTPYPECYRCPFGLKPTSCQTECLDHLEDQVFGHLVPPDEVAAIVVEPIQGESGYLVPPDHFLQRLRALAAAHGILLVADEIQSGIGRTGRMFAVEHAGVKPDIIAIAKGIASGLPLGVVLARADVMTWPAGTHASTFGGNPVSCAAAVATVELVRNGLMDNAADVGAYLLAGLEALKEKHDIIGDVRGRGLMIGIELVRDRTTKERATRERDLVVWSAFRRGLLVLGAGKNVIRLCPPLILSRDQASTALRILDDSFTDLATHLENMPSIGL